MSVLSRSAEACLVLLAVGVGTAMSSFSGPAAALLFPGGTGQIVDPTAPVGIESAAVTADRSLQLSTETLPAADGPRQADLFPDLPLIDHASTPRLFRSELATGKILCMAMFYTRCQGTCPGTISKILRLRRALTEDFGRENIHFVCVTLDPEHDQPEVLQRYAQALGIDKPSELAPIYLCTGSTEIVNAIRRATGMYDPDPAIEADISQHPAKILIGNHTYNRWSSMPAGLPFEDLRETALRIAGVSDHQRYSTRLDNSNQSPTTLTAR